MLDSRTEDILAAAIREYIRTGEPVSSGLLYDKYDFGIKPAMIRLILKDLDRTGYLEQPNYSAGRIPSDHGYEFFADYVLREAETPGALSRELIDPFERHEWPRLLSELSRELGLLSVAARLAAHETYKSGLEMLVDRLEWRSHAELKAVIRDFEALDERITDAEDEFARDDAVQIFVGRKSPVTRSAYLSVVSCEYDADGERVMLFAIGPKRMDYQKTAKVLKNLKVATKNKNNAHERRTNK